MPKSKHIDQKTRENAANMLVRLADAMEGCDEGDSSWKWYQREYKMYAKILMPDMYKFTRKPSQVIIRTLKNCTCGSKQWTFKRDHVKGAKFLCAGEGCNREGEFGLTYAEARDNWNNTFEESIQPKLF